MVIFCSLPVALSLAETLRMPLASMSKVTSICGTPRGRGRDAVEVELAERAVVAGHLALALQHVDLHRGLVVGGGGEDLALPGRDGRVALDQLGHHAAQGLDAQGQRRDVEQQHVLDLAGQDAALDGGAHGHHLVGVDALVRLLAEDLLHQLLDLRDAGRAADQHHLVDLRWRSRPASFSAWRAGPDRALDAGRRSSCSSLARVSFSVEVLGPEASAVMNGRLISVSCVVDSSHLGLLGRLLEALQGHRVLARGRCPGPS